MDDANMNLGRWPAGLEQVARRVQVDLGAEFEILLGAAGNQRSNVEYRADVRRDQRAGELRIGDVAGDGGAGLIGGNDLAARRQRPRQRGTDVARGAGYQYSHGHKYSK